MKARIILLLSCAVISVVGYSIIYDAKPRVKAHILQKGLYADDRCLQTNPNPSDCLCVADIRYPQFINLPNRIAQKELNSELELIAASNYCNGKPMERTPHTYAPGRKVTFDFEKTFMDHYRASFLFEREQTYANNAGTRRLREVDSLILDYNAGRRILPADFFDGRVHAQLNKALTEKLRDKYDDDLSALIRDGEPLPFFTAEGCYGCVVYLTPKGWNFRFRPYAVAKKSVGEPEVVVAFKSPVLQVTQAQQYAPGTKAGQGGTVNHLLQSPTNSPTTSTN